MEKKSIAPEDEMFQKIGLLNEAKPHIFLAPRVTDGTRSGEQCPSFLMRQPSQGL